MKERRIRLLAACEAIGGILAVIGYASYAVVRPSGLTAWQFVWGVAFGAFAAYAGVQLVLERDAGIVPTLLVQAIQLISFTIVPAVRFVALAGLRAELVIASNGVHGRFGGGGEFIAIPFAPDGTLDGVGTELHFGIRIADKLEASTVTVGINLVAAYFLWRLLALRREARKASLATAPPSAPAT